MSIRITGMYSGLDTESIIQQLASAQSVKKNNMVKAQTKVSWKQDAWKALNTKIYNFYTNVLDNMRWQSSYMKKTTKVSNSNAVSIITSSTAPNSVQSMKIKELAKQAYMTGASVNRGDNSGKKFSEYSTLGDMGFSGTGSFRVNAGGKETDITISEDMKISDVVKKLESAGLTASFDSKQQRFYLSSKTSGEKANFAITSNDANGQKLLSTLGLVSAYKADSAEYKEYAKWAEYGLIYDDEGNKIAGVEKTEAREAAEKAEVEKLIAAKKASTDALNKSNEELQKRLDAYFEANTQDEGGNYKYNLYDDIRDIFKVGALTEEDIKQGIKNGTFNLTDYANSLYDKLYGVEKPKVDENGDPVYKQQVDEDGNPMVDEFNNPIYVQQVDKDGNPVEDEDGNPVYEQVMELSSNLKTDLDNASKALNEALEHLAQLNKDGADEDEIRAADEKVFALTKAEEKAQSDYNAMVEYQSYVRAIANTQNAIQSNKDTIADNETYYTVGTDEKLTAEPKAEQEVEQYFESKIKAAIAYKADADAYINDPAGSEKDTTDFATKIEGQDATIFLNGVEYTNSTNTFEINGLTITAQLETGDEEITVTTTEDTDGIYDMIKNFFTEYNKLINEMSALYNADSSKGYEPLLAEEKADLSDSEIEEWEKKIKDSILRNDSTLRTVSDGIKDIMLRGATVNGKTMYLSDFGINTLGYFKSADNEKFAYHINGDKEDSAVAQEDEDLKNMIAADPDTVMKFFSSLANNLHDELADKMKSVEGVSSAFTVYNDKTLQKEYDDYKDKIKKEEEKLNDLMDRWYNKFSVMETALAKLQSKNNAVMGMFGN